MGINVFVFLIPFKKESKEKGGSFPFINFFLKKMST